MPGVSCGPLAQLVEQKTFNLLVDGSNPSRPTIQSGPAGTGVYQNVISAGKSGVWRACHPSVREFSLSKCALLDKLSLASHFGDQKEVGEGLPRRFQCCGLDADIPI